MKESPISSAEAGPHLRGPYTLFTRITLLRDGEGIYYADQLWQRDLVRHFPYIDRLSICCPVVATVSVPDGFLPVQELSDANVFAQRQDRGWGSVFANFLPNFLVVRRAVRASRVVHSGAAGWAFPCSYYILPLRPFLRFKWLVVIESSDWMVLKGRQASLRRRFFGAIHEALVRACLRSADARIFTQSWYRDRLLGKSDNTLIAPAVWVVPEDIRPGLDAADRALYAEPVLKLMFAGRLIEAKGVRTFIDALRVLDADLAASGEGTRVEATVIGSGPLEGFCREAAASLTSGRVALTVRQPVDYGAPFFEVVRAHHLLVICNEGEEQPRLTFDAWSQGRPVLASATSGNRDVARATGTGELFPVGDPAALAERLAKYARSPALLLEQAEASLAAVRGNSIDQMHRNRAKFLSEVFEMPQDDKGGGA